VVACTTMFAAQAPLPY